MKQLFPVLSVPDDPEIVQKLKEHPFPDVKGNPVFKQMLYTFVLACFGLWPILSFPDKLTGVLWVSPVLLWLLVCLISQITYMIRKTKKISVYVNTFNFLMLIISLLCSLITLLAGTNFDTGSLLLCFCLFYAIALACFFIALHRECTHYYERLRHTPILAKIPLVSSVVASAAGYFVGKVLLAWTAPHVIVFVLYCAIVIFLVPLGAKLLADCRYFDRIASVSANYDATV